jgi:hypothetical protein
MMPRRNRHICDTPTIEFFLRSLGITHKETKISDFLPLWQRKGGTPQDAAFAPIESKKGESMLVAALAAGAMTAAAAVGAADALAALFLGTNDVENRTAQNSR